MPTASSSATSSEITPISGLQRQELASAVREYLNEVGSGYVTGTVINDAIDRASRKLNTDTSFNRQQYNLWVATGMRQVELPGFVEEIYDVTWGSSYTRIEPTSRAELMRDNPGWLSATGGTPTQYYVDGIYIGFDVEVTTGTYVHIWCLRTPDKLVTNTAVPTWCPTRFHDTIAKGAALEIAAGFDSASAENPPKMMWLRAEYNDERQQMARLSDSRSREQQPRCVLTGYSQFRR